MRLEVSFHLATHDARRTRILKKLEALGLKGEVVLADVFLLPDDFPVEARVLESILGDPVLQSLGVGPSSDVLLPGWHHALEIGYRPGVTDPLAATVRRSLITAVGRDPGPHLQTAVLHLFRWDDTPSEELLDALAKRLHNPLVQECRILSSAQPHSWRLVPVRPREVPTPPVETIPLLGLDEEGLLELSRQRLLALDLAEMRAIQAHYLNPLVQAERRSRGLPLDPTDVELEMLAQSWSEHCKHKIFNALIEYREGDRVLEIDSLFKTFIVSTTQRLKPRRPFLRSVFEDNSGVIAVDDKTLVCFKVETHNSPSALDPFGGAITGILGVNRDILGTGLGAKPIFNTDVLCFAPPDTDPSHVPPGLIHPAQVLEGVHRGIVEGGNHSGIPTVAGAFVFDESYLGKPLVYCGTGGILPPRIRGKPSWVKSVKPGHYAVMVGGRVGKDGIHGATFSSLALDESSPVSAVQIGDPFLQKIVADFLLEARDRGLFEAITDNGAGGLSSSLGEMARECGGIRVDLDACPLKYPGLAPWEIWVSESQERMSLAVPPRRWPELLELARRRGVEVSKVGEFTDTGWIELYHAGTLVGLLRTDFVHHGLPKPRLKATWAPPAVTRSGLGEIDLVEVWKGLLADPNLASREGLIRQYDHEVQGRTLVRPFCGQTQAAPSDGAVLLLESGSALSVTHGLCPRVGDADTYAMAACAVDEAYRAHIALGGEPDFAAVLDNFCWPDPVSSTTNPDGEYKLAQLVRACQGLRDACLAYGLPLISGKDSMKNDALIGGRKISVRPTLLISLVGRVSLQGQSLRHRLRGRILGTDAEELFHEESFVGSRRYQWGDLLALIGPTGRDFAGSALERLLGRPLEGVPLPDFAAARRRYRRVHRALLRGLLQSIHDLAEGGLAVALFETLLGNRLGARLDLAEACAQGGLTPQELLFSETPSRFLVTVDPLDWTALQGLFPAGELTLLGRVCRVDDSCPIEVFLGERQLLALDLAELLEPWRRWEERWP